MKTVLKVFAALAAIAGAIYVAATYGDTIVAWAKKLVNKCCCSDCCCCEEDCCCEDDCCCDTAEEAVQADEADFAN